MVRKLLYIALSLILTMYYFVPNETMDKGGDYFTSFTRWSKYIFIFYRKEKALSLKGQFFKHSTFAVVWIDKLFITFNCISKCDDAFFYAHRKFIKIGFILYK